MRFRIAFEFKKRESFAQPLNPALTTEKQNPPPHETSVKLRALFSTLREALTQNLGRQRETACGSIGVQSQVRL